MKIQTARESWR